MDYTKDVNIMPYGEYGEMLSSGELIVVQLNYSKANVTVMDKHGNDWKVTYDNGFKARLTRVR